MFSFLLDRRGVPGRYARVSMLGLMVLAAGWSAARAQAPAVEPIPPTPNVVVHGTDSPFDLADLGPDFATSWINAALPELTAADETPPLLQRVATAAGADHSGQQTRTRYERANDGRLLERHVEQRRGAMWRPVQRSRYRYRNGALTARRTEVWLDGTWHLDQKMELVRNAEGKVTTVVRRTWRNAQWIPKARFTISAADTSQPRPAAGSVVQRQIIRATWSGGTWQPATRVTFIVAEAGRHITQRNEVWAGATWEDSVRLTCMYDGAGYPIEKSLAVWAGDGWADGPLHLYDYDVHGERVEQRTETWVGTRHVRTERAQLMYAVPVQTPLLGEASFD